MKEKIYGWQNKYREMVKRQKLYRGAPNKKKKLSCGEPQLMCPFRTWHIKEAETY